MPGSNGGSGIGRWLKGTARKRFWIGEDSVISGSGSLVSCESDGTIFGRKGVSKFSRVSIATRVALVEIVDTRPLSPGPNLIVGNRILDNSTGSFLEKIFNLSWKEGVGEADLVSWKRNEVILIWQQPIELEEVDFLVSNFQYLKSRIINISMRLRPDSSLAWIKAGSSIFSSSTED